MRTPSIDLTDVRDILIQSTEVIEAADGINLDDSDGISKPRELAATVTRDLLYLADRLEFASQLVRREYWAVKGYDPIERG